ncbi:MULTISPECIES: O-antigen ligase family protein [Halomonadaceae]|uniref:O-antigen ligase-related domain-containing protein n=1 Tax=Vreelandella halophila TaxID=86177 RepID=A0A9X4YCB1_9GAMM|nr:MULTISPECIES: O-antigen ligase family protein [Halomonas]MYL25280.1 hypothetical protein [Halomonas utahensis]MYL75342.1 hypothetical protein [Halomonas sp. 22501_18_FS]
MSSISGERPPFTWFSAILHGLTLLPLWYCFTLMWWLPEGVKYVPGLVVLALLAFVANRGWRFRDTTILQRHKAFLWAFWLWMAYSLVIFFWMEDSWTEVRGYLAAAIYISVIAGFRLSARHLFILLAVSATGLITLSLWQFTQGVPRIHGFINANTYAAALGGLSVVIACIATGARNRWVQSGLAVLALLLASALFMTGTRGVSATFCIIVVAASVILVIRSRQKLPALVGVAALSIVLIPTGWMLMEDRVERTFHEVENLEHSTSIGLRLEMWEAGFRVISESPIVGVGEGHYAIVDNLYEQGLISERLHRFQLDHFHNQLLDYTVKKGLIGVTLFIALILAALRSTWLNRAFPAALMAGLALVALYGGTSMSSVPFHHPETIFLFFLTMTLLGNVTEKEPGSQTA